MDDDDQIEWLMAGDPSIRWQVMRDLLDASYEAQLDERALVAETGWGRRLLDEQSNDGRWTADGEGYRGLYTPKWTSTTYTLLLLRRLGLEPRHPAALRGCEALVEGSQWFDDGSIAPWSSPKTDTCVCAMILGILEWFDYDAHDHRDGLLAYLLDHQKPDGGWNCHQDSDVGSFHTTLSTLEALQLRAASAPDDEIAAATQRGREYLLKRKLFRSLRTDEVVRSSFKLFSFPPRWYYDVLRALDYLQSTGIVPDSRCDEAVQLVRSKRRKKDGRWPLQNRHSGETFFEMEKPGAPSRWNTLRALRVLRWWNGTS